MIKDNAQEPTLRKSFTLQKSMINCACPYDNSEYIAVGLSSGLVNLLPINSSKSIKKLSGHKGSVNCIETCGIQPYLASGGDDGDVRLWVGNEVGDSLSLNVKSGPIKSMSLSSQFDRIIVAPQDAPPSIWDPRHCSKLIDFVEQNCQISTVSLSSDGLVALAGSYDGTFMLYDIRTGSPTKTIKTPSKITCSSIRQNGSSVAVGCEDGVVLLWDTRTQSIVNNSVVHNGAITSVSFHPKKPILLTSSTDSTIGVCDADTRSLFYTLKCHTMAVNNVRWSSDGTSFSSCGLDKRVVIWDEPLIESTNIENSNSNKITKKRTIEKLGKFNQKIPSSESPPMPVPETAQQEVNIKDTGPMRAYVGMMHQVADQIASLSITLSRLEGQMQIMDEQISILETTKREQAKAVLQGYVN